MAIGRTSKFAFTRLMKSAGKMEAAGFLRDLAEAVSYTIYTVLTDNGIQFTSRARDIHDSQHIFERVPMARPCVASVAALSPLRAARM